MILQLPNDIILFIIRYFQNPSELCNYMLIHPCIQNLIIKSPSKYINNIQYNFIIDASKKHITLYNYVTLDEIQIAVSKLQKIPNFIQVIVLQHQYANSFSDNKWVNYSDNYVINNILNKISLKYIRIVLNKWESGTTNFHRGVKCTTHKVQNKKIQICHLPGVFTYDIFPKNVSKIYKIQKKYIAEYNMGDHRHTSLSDKLNIPIKYIVPLKYYTKPLFHFTSDIYSLYNNYHNLNSSLYDNKTIETKHIYTLTHMNLFKYKAKQYIESPTEIKIFRMLEKCNIKTNKYRIIMTNVKCIDQSSIKFPQRSQIPICKFKSKNPNNKYNYKHFKSKFNKLTYDIFREVKLPCGIGMYIIGSAILKALATNKNIKSRRSDIDIAVHMEYLKTYSLIDVIKIFLCRGNIFKMFFIDILFHYQLIDSMANIVYNIPGAKKYILNLIKHDNNNIYFKNDLKSQSTVKIPIEIISPRKIIVRLQKDLTLEFFQIDIPIHEIVRIFDFPPVRAVYDLKDLFVYYSAAESHCTSIIHTPDIHQNIKLTRKKTISNRISTYNKMFDYHTYHNKDTSLFRRLII